jgi:hypothetical protein
MQGASPTPLGDVYVQHRLRPLGSLLISITLHPKAKEGAEL